MYVPYKTFRAALDRADFPEEVRAYLSADRLIMTGRQQNSPLRFLRAGGPQSEPLWDVNALKNWLWRKYNKVAPFAVTQFIRALDELCASERIAKANDRDRKAVR